VLQKFTLDVSPLPAESVTIVVGSENLNVLLAEEIAINGDGIGWQYVSPRRFDAQGYAPRS